MRMILVYTLVMTFQAPPNTPATPPRRSPAEPVRTTSAALFKGAREIEIDHGGAIYRLRQTALGKLILTK